MTKKKLQLKLHAYKFGLGALVLSLLAVGGYGVKAYTNGSTQAPSTVVENHGVVNITNPADTSGNSEALGAVASAYRYNPEECINDQCSYYVSADFTSGTTTLVNIKNPYLTVSSTSSGAPVLRTDGTVQWIGNTTTVDFAAVQITGVATSSAKIVCGSATGVAATPSVLLIDSGTVPTSTLAYIENNLTDTLGGAGVTGSTTQKIMLTPDAPYFNCVVSTADYANTTPFTQSSSAFDGSVKVRFHRYF